MSAAFRLSFVFMALLALSFPGTSRSQEGAGDQARLLRVGGNYVVQDIRKSGDHSYEIEFRAAEPTGKYDRVVLTSDHVHMSVTVGQKLRISAEVVATDGDVVQATQVLIFVPSTQGPMPVWMLSSRAKSLDLKASKYLQMHAPQTDYTVF